VKAAINGLLELEDVAAVAARRGIPMEKVVQG
jgi:hypothetical protein